LSTLDSDFQLQEIVLQTIRLNTHDVSLVTSTPDSRSKTEGVSDGSNDKTSLPSTRHVGFMNSYVKPEFRVSTNPP
ncbi:hypothetical protein BJV78DRAFT_375833, partial [Lactifluus subvellereus]